MTMLKSKGNIVLGVFVLVNLIVLAYVLFFSGNKVVYCDSQKLFAEFKLKKELQHRLERDTRPLQVQLDSMAQALERLQNAGDKVLLNELIAAYSAKKGFLEEQRQALTTKYDQQIWNQLNFYLKEYGEFRQLDFIIGGSSVGEVIFHGDRVDRTDEIIEYVNAKYVQE